MPTHVRKQGDGALLITTIALTALSFACSVDLIKDFVVFTAFILDKVKEIINVLPYLPFLY
jgi:hypothetical protein